MNFAFGNTGKHYNREWHETREEARRETFDISEWGNVDQVKYDLDTVDFSAKAKDSTYRLQPRIVGEAGTNSGFDIRDLEDR